MVFVGCDTQQLLHPILTGSEGVEIPVNIGERESGTLYKLGEMLVQYDEDTWRQVDTTDTPIAVVDDMLTEKGYAPKVVEVLPDFRIEVVQIGNDADPLPLLKELKMIPGVITAELNTLLGVFDIATRESIAYQPSIIPPEFVRIRPVSGAETEDGLLYRLGAMVVRYDDRTFDEMDSTPTPIAVVNEFLLNQGYAPRTIGIFSHFNVEVIDVGEDIDPAIMFEELKSLPGVIDVQRNILHDMLQQISGNILIPDISGTLEE